MDLDKIAARLRPRTAFEAIDLGFLLARRFARPLWSAFALSALPVMLATALVCLLTGAFWWPLLAVWWLRPLYARAVLFVLSRAFFGAIPAPLIAVRHTLVGLLRPSNFLRNLGELTVFRLSPFRSFSLPVRELEGQRGLAASRRTRALLDADAYLATLLFYAVSILVEFVFFVAVHFLIFSALTEDLSDLYATQFDLLYISPGSATGTFRAFMLGLYVLLVAALEPLLVAGNFALYVSRRVTLEGWDIELAFRKLARRLESESTRSAGPSPGGPSPVVSSPTPPSRSNTASTLATLVAAGFATALVFALPAVPVATGAEPAPLQDAPPLETSSLLEVTETGPLPDAASLDEPSAAQPDPQQLITTILEAPEFGQTRTEKYWRARHRPASEAPSGSEHLERFSRIVAVVLRIVLWILAVCSVVLATYYIVRHLRRRALLASRQAAATPAPAARIELVSDLAPDHESVVSGELLTRVRRAWERGDDVGALSLLYAGTLQALHVHHAIIIAPSQTPYECVRTVRARGGPHELVAQVARAWTTLAFARRPLDEGEFSALLTTWQHVFGAQPLADGDVR